MKKIFSVSVLAILTAMPAFADNITNNSMCVVDVLNQSNNASTANINAMWSANTYTEPAGQYLLYENGAITQHVTCPAGYYCEGFEDETFNDESIGIHSCADNDESYPYSAAGAKYSGYCYNTGTVSCATINPYTGGHGTAVYGNSTNGNASYKTYSEWGDTEDMNSYALDTIGACAITSLTCATGYTSNNTNGALANYVHQYVIWDYNEDMKYRALNGDSGSNSGNNDQGSHTGMTNGDWQVGWPDGTTVHGHSTCVAQNVTTNPWNNNNTWTDGDSRLGTNALTAGQYNDTDARYCWCQMDSYALAGGASVASAGAWVFDSDHGSASFCASDCAPNCASHVQYNSYFRAAVFGSLGTNMECTANTINLNWYADATSQTPLTVNTEAQQCTYDQRITIPSTEPTKPGYTFSGWVLRQTQNNNNN